MPLFFFFWGHTASFHVFSPYICIWPSMTLPWLNKAALVPRILFWTLFVCYLPWTNVLFALNSAQVQLPIQWHRAVCLSESPHCWTLVVQTHLSAICHERKILYALSSAQSQLLIQWQSTISLSGSAHQRTPVAYRGINTHVWYLSQIYILFALSWAQSQLLIRWHRGVSLSGFPHRWTLVTWGGSYRCWLWVACQAHYHHGECRMLGRVPTGGWKPK